MKNLYLYHSNFVQTWICLFFKQNKIKFKPTFKIKKKIKELLKLKRSFITNGLLQYFGNTSCHYQAKISKEKLRYFSLIMATSIAEVEFNRKHLKVLDA